MARLGLSLNRTAEAAQIAAWSRSLLDRPLLFDAELWIAVVGDAACILGAFQRAGHLRHAAPPMQSAACVLRRGSGGPEVLVGPGTVHLALALAHPAALVPCDERRIVNRHVRPLLRALTRAGSPAAFFGRDWISVAKRPAGWVGFGHDSSTRRTLFEAFIGVSSPFALSERPSFRGKAAGTLESLTGRTIEARRVAEAIADAYAALEDVETLEIDAPHFAAGAPSVATVEPPWAATCEEAIGLLGAGVDAQGIFRVGGDLLASRDALARLETRAAVAAPEQVGGIVDETLSATGVALDGVRSLAHVGDLIVRARKG